MACQLRGHFTLLVFQEKLEVTKGVIKIRKSKKNRQQKEKKDKRTNIDLQNIHIKLKSE